MEFFSEAGLRSYNFKLGLIKSRDKYVPLDPSTKQQYSLYASPFDFVDELHVNMQANGFIKFRSAWLLRHSFRTVKRKPNLWEDFVAHRISSQSTSSTHPNLILLYHADAGHYMVSVQILAFCMV